MAQNLQKEIDAIFKPRSIAVVGVSDRANRLGNLMLYSFMDIGFEGPLYPVNAKEETVMGLKCSPRIRDIEGPVDLAVISVHPDRVSETIDDCIEKRVRAAVIFSSGFREKGNEGQQKEKELVEKARAGGVRIIGPNCMGLYSPTSKISFFPGFPKETGKIAFLSQSGSLANILGLFGAEKGIRFSKMISVGNASDLTVNDFLEYLGSDPETGIIVCYIEGIDEGRKFLELAKNISLTKPILVWKVGETAGGERAVSSHTGSLTGSRTVWESALKQAGIIKVENLTELLGHLTAFQNPSLPSGNRVAIISGPGGPAVSTADACEKAGLQLSHLSPKTQNELAEIIPDFGSSASNPVDLSLTSSFDMTMYPRATESCGMDENVDMIIEYIAVLRKELIDGLMAVQERIRKPIAIITSLEFATVESSLSKLFGSIDRDELIPLLMKMYDSGISVYSSEQDAAKSLMALLQYRIYCDRRASTA